MQGFKFTLAVFGSILFFNCNAYAQTELIPYRDSMNHYSMLVPEGWRPFKLKTDRLCAHDTNRKYCYTGMCTGYYLTVEKMKRLKSLSDARKIYLANRRQTASVIDSGYLQNNHGYWYFERDTIVRMCFGQEPIFYFRAIFYQKKRFYEFTGEVSFYSDEGKKRELYMKMAESFKLEE